MVRIKFMGLNKIMIFRFDVIDLKKKEDMRAIVMFVNEGNQNEVCKGRHERS